jgi:CubicO group peptidase (beta-lactamase class C family)
MYLLGSISKPIVITGLMSLFDGGAFRLEDRVSKFVPEFRGEGREEVTIQQVLTHVSGLPDQLANNAEMRKAHAPLSEFVLGAARTPLQFKPGTQYDYSSMGILLASRVAEVISGSDIRAFTERVVMGPLGMTRSAQGLGKFEAKDFVPMQIEFAAPEAGGGDPSSVGWNWNSAYWRALGAPWGGTHASAADVAKWLGEFLLEQGRVIRPATARLMASNRNPAGLESRGLALDVGESLAGRGASDRVFGHTGSTGTIAWADPVKRVICVVLTGLPARAVKPHPRDQAAEAVAGLLG